MRLGKDLLNRPVITIDDGRLLGRVQDIYIDPEMTAVAGLYLGSQGLLKRRAQLIDREDVVVFGVDAILARTAGVITDDHEHPPAKLWQRRDDVTGRDVNTPGGTKLGVAGDLVVDESGVITAVALSRTFVEGPLATKRAIDRRFILDVGSKESPMTADLAALEAELAGPAPVEPESPAKEAPPVETIEITAEDTGGEPDDPPEGEDVQNR